MHPSTIVARWILRARSADRRRVALALELVADVDGDRVGGAGRLEDEGRRVARHAERSLDVDVDGHAGATAERVPAARPGVQSEVASPRKRPQLYAEDGGVVVVVVVEVCVIVSLTFVLMIRVTFRRGTSPSTSPSSSRGSDWSRPASSRLCTTRSPGRRVPLACEKLVAVAGSAFTAATPAFKPCLGDVQRPVRLAVASERMLVRGGRRHDRGGRDREHAHHDQRQDERDALFLPQSSNGAAN